MAIRANGIFPCKTAQNNVLSPKPPLLKTNDKTTLGGICGSSEFCLPDSQVSQPHYAILLRPHILSSDQELDVTCQIPASLRNALHPWTKLDIWKTVHFYRQLLVITLWTDAPMEGWGETSGHRRRNFYTLTFWRL